MWSSVLDTLYFEKLIFQAKGPEIPGRKFDGTKCPKEKLKELKCDVRYIKKSYYI